jgi:hypothetical protein
MDNLEAALKYAARGWPVFPVWWPKNGGCACGKPDCTKPGKHPLGKLVPKGRNNATTDPEIIRGWWKEYPRANVAIVTGPESGLLAMDVDPRNGGEASWKRIVAEVGTLPLTSTTRTGGGGWHYVVQHPGNNIKSIELTDYPGIDIKAKGGSIIAPPSLHISGQRYSWQIPPESTPPVQCPQWLISLVSPNGNRSKKTIVAEGEVINEAKRNATLASLAGSMRQRGMTAEEIEAALLAVNAGRCNPPLPENEVRRVASSVGSYEPGGRGGETNRKPTQAELLLLAAADAELWHTPDFDCYVTVHVEDHKENWPIRSKGFRRWLLRRFYEAHGKAPGAQAVQDALGVLEARAQFEGQEQEVHVRVAHTDGAIYIDLCDDQWRAGKITSHGWQVVADPPVKFRRSKGMASLSVPQRGGSLIELRRFLNVKSEGCWRLFVAILVAAFSPGPYPILALQGEQGSAKTTAARLLKALLDPGTTPLRSIPKEVRDLMIAANNSWCLTFDNLSGLPDWLADAFCRLSTGGGFGTRELYTDAEECLFESMRPVTLNGITSLVTKQDLADRAVIIDLPQIDDKDRLPEKVFWQEFEKARPRILGALLDAVVSSLANHDRVRLAALPRMADFAIWVTAAEPALGWPAGSFLKAYTGNRSAVVEQSLEADQVAVAVRLLLAGQDSWEGNASALLEALETLIPESTRRSKPWPKAAHVLSNRLKRASTFLRKVGLEVEFSKSGDRKITIRQGSGKSVQSVQSAQAQDEYENPPDAAVDASPDLDASNGRPDASQKEASMKKDKKIWEMDAQDAADAKFSTHSISEEDDLLEGEI